MPANPLSAWLCTEALPFWASTGIEPESGACRETVTAVATAPAGPELLRARVQTRQIYTYCVAHYYGWFGESPSVINGLESYLEANAAHPRHSFTWVHSTTPGGDIASALLDTYDMAFALLACAWQVRAFGDTGAQHRASAITELLETQMRANNGGWLEGNYPARLRRQNPHMHLLEAFIALHQADGSPYWLDFAGEVIALLEQHFFDPRHGVLLEYFDQDWQPAPKEGPITVEPGHMAEWIYLLKRYAVAKGQPLHPVAHRLYETVCRLGRDPHSGLLYNQITPTGRPLDAGKRLWPQVEWIKANLVMALEGEAPAVQRACEGAQRLLQRYMTGCTPGTYLDLIDADDRPVSTPCPASTMYHITSAAAAWEDFTLSRADAPAALPV